MPFISYYDKKERPCLQAYSYKKFCIPIRIKSSASRLYQIQKEGFRPEMEACPYCGSRGCCVSFASYERYVLDFLNGHPACETVRVPRIRCGSCGRTHAILTDSLVPYRSYSLFFILRVIGEYLLHLQTVERLCIRFGITHSMLYRWFRLFQDHKAEWLGMGLLPSSGGLCPFLCTAPSPTDSVRRPSCPFSSRTQTRRTAVSSPAGIRDVCIRSHDRGMASCLLTVVISP